MTLMSSVVAVVALASAFGVSLTQEQSAAITGLGAIVVNLIAYFWKTGQQAA